MRKEESEYYSQEEGEELEYWDPSAIQRGLLLALEEGVSGWEENIGKSEIV